MKNMPLLELYEFDQMVATLQSRTRALVSATHNKHERTQCPKSNPATPSKALAGPSQ